ncbi:MAG: RNA pseudouridine synthase [Candidatus Omnitrophota bacterium]|jgi:23S rRNA pseudouridine1911/1915/1917 synthase
MNIPAIYEDDFLSVFDKPAGLLTIPAPGGREKDLTGILNSQNIKERLPFRFHPCHRLDRETSGLIIYAKGKSTQKKIMDMFRDRMVKKTYLAVLHGCPAEERGTIRGGIEGRPAVTSYEVLFRHPPFTVVRAYPETGRTNQLRIHFTRMGNPIVGESRFIFRRDFALRAKRVLLHASELEFRHPYSGKQLSLRAPLPQDMRNFFMKHGVDPERLAAGSLTRPMIN